MFDLASKFLVFAALGDATSVNTANPADNALWLLPGALRLVSHYNTGGAFGLASGRLLLFLGATAVLVPALVLTAYYNREPDAPLWSLGLIVGGALGNLYDRLFHVGVRDFLELMHPHTGRSLWPVFNLADVAIVVGVVIYLIWTILDHVGKRRQAAYDQAAQENEP